jgi:glycosyltransferase involved in cell wall biosynthesis
VPLDHDSGPIGILAPIELAELRDYLSPRDANNISSQVAGASPIHLLCKSLLARGRRVVVFSLHPSIEERQVFEGERLRIYLGPIAQRSVLNFFKEERRFLANAIKSEKLACLHAHWTYEYALAAIDSGVPYVVTAHDAPLTYLRWNGILNPYDALYGEGLKKAARNSLFWLARTLIAYRAARNAKRLTAVSPYVAQHMRQYGFHAKPIEVIPNGMPSEFLDRKIERLSRGTFTFATALGGWGQLKNGDKAIAAFAKVRAVLPDTKMLMFGGGYAPDGPAAAWARKKSYDQGIEFRGRVLHSEIINTFARDVDVLVHPSHVEAHPMPVIEAMSLGIPVIGGNAAGGVPWTLGEGAYGLLVDVRSPEAIAAAMLQLASDISLQTRLGAAARESIRQRFRLDQVVEQYEIVYEQLASNESFE